MSEIVKYQWKNWEKVVQRECLAGAVRDVAWWAGVSVDVGERLEAGDPATPTRMHLSTH